MDEEAKAAPWWRRSYIHIAALLVTIGIIVSIIIFGLRVELSKESVEEFENYGYIFIFFMGIAGSAAPIWPLPGSWAAFAGAALGWNLIFVALAAGIGEAIGEISGYVLGYSGQPTIANSKRYQRLQGWKWAQRFRGWMKRHGSIAVFLSSAVPNFGVVKLVNASAGALRFSLRKWFLICWLGKTIKSFGFALAGAGLFEWLTDLI